jgi:hypothetical protein
MSSTHLAGKVEYQVPQVVPYLNKKEQLVKCLVAHLAAQVEHQVPQVVPDLSKNEKLIQRLVADLGYIGGTQGSTSSS